MRREQQMKSFSVNLLPVEMILRRKQNLKLTLINRVSIIALVFLVFATSATLTLRLIQSKTLEREKKDLVFAEGKITGFKDNEGGILLLKQRLSKIQTLSGEDIPRKAIFNLIIYLTPQEIEISEIVVDRRGNVIATLSTSSLPAFTTLVDNLGDKEKNMNLIKSVNLENMSYGRDSLYRFSLKIAPT